MVRHTTQSEARRAFLKRSLAYVGLPFLYLSGRATAEPVNERLNVALIGAGGRGDAIGAQAAALGNMMACADVNRRSAGIFAAKYRGKCQTFRDYRQMLDSLPDLDAVLIATPDHWHVPMALEAMRAGKAVYCEKPLTLTIAEGRLIGDAVQQSGAVFQVGMQQRSECNDFFLQAVAIARSGRLGDPSKLNIQAGVGTAERGGPFAIADPPSELDYEQWLGTAPYVPYCENRANWRFRWWVDYSGGQITDWGVHHLDIGLWIWGVCPAKIRIEKSGPCTFPLGGVDLPNGRQQVRDYLLGRLPVSAMPASYNVAHEFDVTFRMDDRADGGRFRLTSGINEIIITGERARIRVNRGSLTGKPVEEIRMDRTESERLAEEVETLYGGPRHGHMRNFFDAIAGIAQPIADVGSHLNCVNLCHAANIAMLLDRPLTFLTREDQFEADDEANQLCQRSQAHSNFP
ncbi:MAG: Gfo/Idh/MocA family oxidoreductase [Thermoguttaceae bacterium]|nr:Gfo/Idh/MocA family oxidoreductase [Thermoguttaceae bacterium]